MNLMRRFGAMFKQNIKETTQHNVLHAILAQARRAQYSEDYDGAQDLFKEAQRIADDSDSEISRFDILLQWVDVLLIKKQIPQAIEVLEKARTIAEAQPGRAAMAYLLVSQGILQDIQGNTEEAETTFEHARAMAKALGALGPQGRATVYLGDLTLREGNASYAIHLLREGIPLLQEAADKDLLPFAFGRLGNALMVSGQELQGRQVINTGLEHGMERRQIAIMRELSFEGGKLAMVAKEYTVAFQYFSNMLKLFPYPERQKHQFVQAHALATYSALKAKKIADAEKLMRSTQSFAFIARDPETMHIVHAIGGLLAYEQQDDEKAIGLMVTALEHAQDLEITELVTELWHTLAQAYLRRRQFDEAFATFSKALETLTTPTEHINLLIARGEANAVLPNRRQFALVDFTSALKIADAQADNPSTPLIYSALGLIEGLMGQGQRALRHIEQSLLLLNTINNAPISKRTFEHVADSYLDYGDLDSSEGLYTKAIELSQTEGDVVSVTRLRGKRGYLYIALNNAAQAITELTEARNQSRDQKLITQEHLFTSYLGSAYAALGDTNTALSQHYEAVANIDYNAYIEETAIAQYNLATTLMAAKHATQQTRSHFRNALDYAYKSDNALLIYHITLGSVMAAMLNRDRAEAGRLLESVEGDIQKSGARRLQAELKTVQSQYFALTGDHASARSSWDDADKLRKIAQMPELHADWLA